MTHAYAMGTRPLNAPNSGVPPIAITAPTLRFYFHAHFLQVLELFGVEGDETVSLLSSSGGPNINSGSTDGDSAEVVESRPSRVFYCVAMACASAFAAMAMTSWARTDG